MRKKKNRKRIRSYFSSIDIHSNQSLTLGQKKFVLQYLDSHVDEKNAQKYAQALITYIDPQIDEYR